MNKPKKDFLLIFSSLLMVVMSACGPSTTNEPFPENLVANEDIIHVNINEFAEIPDHNGEPARMMLLVDEPATSRIFVNDMFGPIYSISYDGSEVHTYIDIDDPKWGVDVQHEGRERGFQSFAFHPDFGREGEPGYGRFYSFSDVVDTTSTPDFRPGGGDNTHHTVLHEWVAQDASSPTYDGDPPRELIRFEQPFGNHNAGLIAFHPHSEPGDDEYGLLYIGSADGGSGGDPLNLAQDLRSAFGKILRIDPLGSNSANGRYGIPEDNPFIDENDALDEIYAYGLRNPQRFGWDSDNGNLLVADIGQNIVESVSPAPKGGNLGWNDWEGSFRFIDRSGVSIENPRSDPDVIYPVVEYSRYDSLMADRVAVTGIHVYRSGPIDQLMDYVLFGDMVNGEIFYFDADNLPNGGNQGFRRIMLHDPESESGEPKTYLELIQQKNAEQGREPAHRTDLRFGTGPDNQVFLLNKQDGTIRVLVP